MEEETKPHIFKYANNEEDLAEIFYDCNILSPKRQSLQTIDVNATVLKASNDNMKSGRINTLKPCNNNNNNRDMCMGKENMVSSDELSIELFKVDSLLVDGVTLWKVPFHTFGISQKRILRLVYPKQHIDRSSSAFSQTNDDVSFMCPTDDEPLRLEVSDPMNRNKHNKVIYIRDIIDIQIGHQTPAFQAYITRNGFGALPEENYCFSVICSNRTYDFYSDQSSIIKLVFESLCNLRMYQHSIENNTNSSLKRLDIQYDHRRHLPVVFDAVRRGDSITFRRYLEDGFPVNTMEQNELRDTPLIAACRAGKSEIVQLALEYDAKNDPHPEFGQTALQVAVSSGNTDCVRLILETAALSNANEFITNHIDSNQEAPIHIAARCNNIEILLLLLRHGANIALVDATDKTCLHCATLSGHDRCLQYLMDYGGTSLLEHKDNQGLTCLHYAVKGNRLECARILLENGSMISTNTPDGMNSWDMANRLKSQKMIRLIRSFIRNGESTTAQEQWNLEDRYQEHYRHWDRIDSEGNGDIFEGLELHNVSNDFTMVYNTENISNIHMYNYSHEAPYGHEYHSNIYYSSNAANNTENDSDQFEFQQQYEDCFWFNGDLWYICYSSGHPYYLRERDNYSQWDDPRIYYVSNVDNYFSDAASEKALLEPANFYQKSMNCNTTETASSSKIDTRVDSDIYHNEWKANDPQLKPSTLHKTSTTETDSRGELLNSIQMLKKSSKIERQKVDSADISNNPVNPLTHQTTSTPKNDSRGALLNSIQMLKKRSDTEIKKDDSLDSLRDPVNPVTTHFMNTATQKLDEGNQNSKEKKIILPPAPPKSSDSNSIFGRYEKMISIGVPSEAVIHKMIKDGVSEDNIKKFKDLQSSQFETNKDSCLGTEDAKDTKNDSDSIDKDSLEKDTQLIKYVKMMSVGVPIQSVIHKMKSDSIDSKKIKQFELVFGNIDDEQPVSEVTAHRITPEIALKQITSDSEIAKYLKMLKVGIPPQSVSNKMRQEGIHHTKIECFDIAYDLQPTNAKKCSNVLPMPPTPSRRTSVKMQKIHWNPVAKEKLNDSLWAAEEEDDKVIDDSEVRMLEDLFGAKSPTTAVKAMRKKSVKKVDNEVRLIELKRSNNIAISLAQYRNFASYDDLCQAVSSWDITNLSGEQLQNMQKLLPTKDELYTINDYKGRTEGLGRAELFFLAISRISNFEKKLNTFVYSILFNDHINEIQNSLGLIEDACLEIVNSSKLAAMLRRLLAVGNLVNEGAGKPRAAGITVDSLLKTATKKGSDGKTSVIDHVVSTLLKQNASANVNCVDFWDEMKGIEEASKIDIKECKNSYKDLRGGFENLQKLIATETAGNISDSTVMSFIKRSQDFSIMAKDKISKTESKFDSVEKAIQSLCSYFAEDAATCQVGVILRVVTEFSKLVDVARETWHRKQRAEKRKALMNTPIKTARLVNSSDRPPPPSPSPLASNLTLQRKFLFPPSAEENDESAWEDS